MTKIDQFDESVEKLKKAKEEIGKIVFGQEDVIDQVLTSIVAGGHVLLIGVPGLAKTLLVETTAHVLGLDSKRVQCTPDLMPADILGSEVLEKDANGKRSFRFIKGPVFTQMLMADEINRASPRTQSALLQAMQEQEVSIAGKAHKLKDPFHVLATQNPIEQEGTYPLPEAQLDRFLMQVIVGYPDEKAEEQMLKKTTGSKQSKPKNVLSAKDLLGIQKLARDIAVGDDVSQAILKLVRGLRDSASDYIAWPPGPRGSQSLMVAAKAKALLDGRPAPSIDDITELAEPVLSHRMALNYKARNDNIKLADALKEQCARL